MRSLFSILLVFSCLRAFSLEVIYNDDGSVTIVGQGGVTTEVITNYLGNCNNCINISKEQAESYKSRILEDIGSTSNSLSMCENSLRAVTNYIHEAQRVVGTFRRYGGSYTINSVGTLERTNFLANVITGVQKDMVDRYISEVPSNQAYMWSLLGCAYSNGIHDFGNYNYNTLDFALFEADYIFYELSTDQTRLASLGSFVQGITVEDCCTSGDGDDDEGGGSCSSGSGCPCEQQLDAIRDYVESLDDSVKEQVDFLNDEYKDFLDRADSYGRAVSRSLYQNGTIKVDNGRNSWTNVYVTGKSDLYSYDKSNVLQRIELLLYGLSFPSATSNLQSIVDNPTSEVTTVLDNAQANQDTFRGASDDLKNDIDGLKDSFQALFRAMNFFGSSRLHPFSLNDPFYAFDVYDFEITSNELDSLTYLQSLVSHCMQIFYIAVGVIYCLWFWYVFIRFGVVVVLKVFHFLNAALS